MLPIHHRMPAILTLADEERWLDPARKTAADLTRLLRPYPDDDFEAYPVSRAVNAPTHNDPKFIEACESPA